MGEYVFVSTLFLQQFSRLEAKKKISRRATKKLLKGELTCNLTIVQSIYEWKQVEVIEKCEINHKPSDEAVSEPPPCEKFLQAALSFWGVFCFSLKFI